MVPALIEWRREVCAGARNRMRPCATETSRRGTTRIAWRAPAVLNNAGAAAPGPTVAPELSVGLLHALRQMGDTARQVVDLLPLFGDGAVQILDHLILIGEAHFQGVDAGVQGRSHSSGCCSFAATRSTRPWPKRDSLVEHEAFAGPAALCCRNGFQIFQDAALEVIDLLEAMRQHEGAGLLAPDAAGAEHRHLLVRRGIELAGDEVPEIAEARCAGSTAPSKVPISTSNWLRVSMHDQTGRFEKRVPVLRRHIGADLPGRIGRGIAQRHDFLLQPDFRRRNGISAAVENFSSRLSRRPPNRVPVPKRLQQRIDRLRAPREGAVDALMGQQERAFQARDRRRGLPAAP